jgi:aquaporin Z
MQSLAFLATRLAPSASLADALKCHWKEYLMEAAELCVLMLGICSFGTVIYSRVSPFNSLGLLATEKAFLMGIAVATTTYFIIRSPFGRRTGAHFNPAITIAYFYLGRVHRWDMLYYLISQFLGATAGVFIAHLFLGEYLAAIPVRYVITTPGKYGSLIAFVAEFVLAGFLMGIVLFATNRKWLAQFSPLIVALVTVLYYGLCSSISGFSVNPARSFSSAMFAWIWQGIWVYFAAPSLGMVAASAIYVHSVGPQKIYCAKVFHDLRSTCPFNCDLEKLYLEP